MYKALILVLVCITQYSFAQVNLNNGLLAYYPFTGNANDVSGNGNNPSFNNATLTKDYYGNNNSAYYFNGIDNYIRIPNHPTLNSPGQISICAYIKPMGFYKGTCHGNRIIMKGDADYLPGNYLMTFDDNIYTGGLNCANAQTDTIHQTLYGVATGKLIGDTPYIQKNIWRSVVYTYDGVRAKLYIDCELQFDGPLSGANFTNNYDLFFGRLNNAQYPYWYNGVLDEVRIYNRAINPDEVKAYSFSCASAPPCSNWLKTGVKGDAVQIGDVDVADDQMTVEVTFNKTNSLGTDFGGGDLVSKHNDASDCNYVLRPTNAEITTTNGHFSVTPPCGISLNKTYHLAMVYDGKTLKLYQNGFLMNEIPATGNLILNNWPTTIGDNASGLPAIAENMIGYINDVRIWKIARTQDQLREYMNVPLLNPAAQTGLISCHTFEDLKNKQGNAAWDGVLTGNAVINQSNPVCSSYTIDSCGIIPGSIPTSAGFTAPDTVCVNSPVKIVGTSVNASTYLWNFCVGDVNKNPIGTDMGNIGGLLELPVFVDYVYDNGTYYGLIVNNFPGGLIRLNFGNSMLNTPTYTNLGNLGGAITNNCQGIQIVKNKGKWYAIMVGGDPNGPYPSQIVKIDFGTSLANNPTGTNWGNIGNMNYPTDLFLFQEGVNWYGLTVNYNNSTITRFNFGIDFDNPPTGQNLGNVGSLNRPSGICPVNDNGIWRVFVTNFNDHTLSRVDFGNSLLNPPSFSTNLGNPGGMLHNPRDVNIFNYCGQIVGFVVNDYTTDKIISRMNFTNLTAVPAITAVPSSGGMNFPHSISKIFREGSELYAFVPNTYINTITRLSFSGGCSNTNIPSSTQETPPQIIYNAPGIYNINLTVNDGQTNQSSFCKQIVVLPKPSVDFSFTQDICNPQSVQFKSESTNYKSLTWDFGNNTSAIDEEKPVVIYNPYGTFDIKLKADAGGGCADSIIKKIPVKLTAENIITFSDTILCKAGDFHLKAVPAISYCWTPVAGLTGANTASPVITTTIPITTYYLNALVPANNLVTNGDFTQGNTGFTSAYNFVNPNSTEGQYFISTKAPAWNAGLSNCGDHTTGAGNMMLVNGNPVPNAAVWKAAVTVTPNTNYAFSTWVQALSSSNPAQLQFSINGQTIGNLITATLPTCNWTQFYTTWNSGNSTSASISIVNKNTLLSGNDFALDDISFSELKMLRDSVTVTINANPEVDFTYDVPLCKSVQLSGNSITEPFPIIKWEWSFGDSQTADANTLTHTYFKGGKYDIKLVATDQNTCKDSLTQTIQLDTITASVSADTMVCPNATIELRGAGGSFYEWSPAALANDATLANPEVTVTADTRFYLKIKNGIQCEDTASILVSIKPRPKFIKPFDRSVCMDSSIQLAGRNDPAYQYAWTPAGTLDNPSAVNPIASPVSFTAYQLTITEPVCGYDTSFEVKVTVNPNPVVSASKQRDIDCINPTTYLNATGGLNYLWSPASGVDNPYSANPMAWADTTTTFIVKTTNEFNCSAYDAVIVKVTNTAKPVFNIPNAFTPNNDGKNDCFRIKHWGNVQIHQLAIYNRWGDLVFSTKNPMDCWDGTYKGKPQAAGTFAYIIKATSFCGEIERKGTLTLIR